MKYVIMTIIMALLAMVRIHGEVVVAEDSTEVVRRSYGVGASAGLFAVAAGAVGHGVSPEFGRISGQLEGHRSTVAADVAQFAPLAMPWLLKACGVPTRSGWGRMAVSQAIGGLLMTGTVESVKRSVTSRRPDGSDWRSFPSGHTARAFFGATVAAIELGDVSPWYAVGSYLFATGVGVSRVIDGRHFPADVVSGAGIGILAAEAGYLLGDVVMGRRDISKGIAAGSVDGADFIVGISSGMRFDIGSVRHGAARLRYMPALTAGLTFDWMPSAVYGLKLGVSAEMVTTYVVTDPVDDVRMNELETNVNSVGVTVMPGYRWRLSQPVAVDLSAGGGTLYNLPLESGAPREADPGRWSPVGRAEAGVSVAVRGRLGCRGALGYEISRRNGATVSSVKAMLTATIGF